MTDDLLVAKETLQKLSKDKSDLAKKQSSLKNKLQKANDVNEATLKDLLTIEDELQEENSKLRKSGSAAEPNGAKGKHHVVSVRTMMPLVMIFQLKWFFLHLHRCLTLSRKKLEADIFVIAGT